MKKKIILFMLAVGLLTITIMTIIMSSTNEKLMVENALNSNENLAHAIAATMDNYLNEVTKTANTLASAPLIKDTLLSSNDNLESFSEGERLAVIEDLNNKWIDTNNINDPFVQNYLSNPVALHLKNQQEVIPNYYGEIFLTNKYGELVASTGKLSTLAHAHKYWWIASDNDGIGRTFFDDRGFDSSVDGYVLGIVVPVYDDNKNIIGILKSNINIIDLFEEIINEYSELLEPGTIMIARTNGLVVFELNQTPLSTTIDEAYLLKLKYDSNLSEVIKNSKKEDVLVNISSIHNTEGSSEIGFGGSYESIDHIQGNTGESWVVVLTQPKTHIDKVANSDTVQAILIGLVLLIVMLIMIFVFARNISKPLEELVIVTDELNKGNLDREIDIIAKDEVNKLIYAYKEMVKRIKNTMASRDELMIEIERRKKLEKENLLMEAKLRNQQKLESIEILAGGVAHEINNPLNGILNYSQLISDIIKNKDENYEDSREDIDEFSAEIIKETNRISKIVRNLLQFSQNEEKTFIKAKIKDIIKDTLLLINTTLKHDRIAIEVDIPKDIPLIECRPQQIQQVIMNLITNARDALNLKYPGYDENKKISLSIANRKFSNKEGIRITIEDYGNGIPESIYEKIFDPFFTTKDRSKGTGLGLSISYGIISDHKGELSVESEEGNYTRFYIDLPVVLIVE